MSISNETDRYLDQLREEGVSACFSILLEREGQVVYRYHRGLSQDGGWPIHAGTKFNIGSVSKPITGALILKLRELEQLRLEDPVRRYIPEFKSDAVSILDMLLHTAGYTDYPPNLSWPHEEELAAYFQKVYEWDTALPPGEASNYYTFGYAILMDILQRITGESIETFARTHLFNPLGMTDTTFDMRKLQSGQYVLPCKLEEQRWDDKLDQLAATGDSSVYATTDDLLKFAGMILGGGALNGIRVFSEESAALMLREVTGGRFAKTPIFWMKNETNTYGCFGAEHSPATVGHPGFSGCMLFLDPDRRKTGAILTNSQRLHADFGNYGRIFDRILRNA